LREKENKEKELKEKEIKEKNTKEKRKEEINEKKVKKEGKNNYNYFFYDCAGMLLFPPFNNVGKSFNEKYQ